MSTGARGGEGERGRGSGATPLSLSKLGLTPKSRRWHHRAAWLLSEYSTSLSFSGSLCPSLPCLSCRFTAYAFAVINVILWLGPQDRGHNEILNVFWCVWWPGSFLVSEKESS